MSPQVNGEGRGEDEAQQHQEGQPGLQEACTAGVRETKLTSPPRRRGNSPPITRRPTAALPLTSRASRGSARAGRA